MLVAVRRALLLLALLALGGTLGASLVWALSGPERTDVTPIELEAPSPAAEPAAPPPTPPRASPPPLSTLPQPGPPAPAPSDDDDDDDDDGDSDDD
jgi:hypothetical protein